MTPPSIQRNDIGVDDAAPALVDGAGDDAKMMDTIPSPDDASSPHNSDDDVDGSSGKDDDDDVKKEEEEEEEDEGGEYETSYSKLAATGIHLPPPVAPSSKGSDVEPRRRRRRRAGYGNAAATTSVLETLPSSAGADDEEGCGKERGDRDEFVADDDDFAAEEEEGSHPAKPTIFMETQDDDDDDDDESGSEKDGGDVEADDDEGDAESEVGDDEGDRSDAESDEERPRGRIKRTGKRREHKAGKSEDEGEGEDEERFSQSEASGYGFSLVESQAPREVDAETGAEGCGDDGEPLVEKPSQVEAGREWDDQVAPAPAKSGTEARGSEPGIEPSRHVSEPAYAPGEDPKESAPEPAPKPATADPSYSQLMRLVDVLFGAVEDKDTMTVGGINRSVASHFGWEKVDKKRRRAIKQRLTDLISGKVDPVADDGAGSESQDSEGEGKSRKKTKVKKSKKQGKKKVKHEPRSDAEEEGEPFDEEYESEEAGNSNDSSSDYEQSRSKRGSMKSGKSNKKSKKSERERDDCTDSDEDLVDGIEKSKKARKKRPSRPKSSKGKGKMAKHLRDRHAEARVRQVEEARIREEELAHLADNSDNDPAAAVAGAEAGPRLSREERERAERIAARLDTESEELRIRRREERVGLIDRLRRRRLEALAEGMDEGVEEVAEAKREDAKEGDAEVKMEEGTEAMDEVKADGEGKPKLTSTEEAAKDKMPKIEKPAEGGAMVDLEEDESDDSDGESDDSDDDLEIVAPGSSNDPDPSTKENSGSKTLSDAKCSEQSRPKVAKKASAMDLLFHTGKTSTIAPQNLRKKKVADPRMAIRNALRAKQIQASNRWLARELGYRNEQDHIRDCKEAEEKKRKETLRLERVEAERIALLEKQAALREDSEYELLDAGDGELDKEEDGEEEYDEEEDEMAMARKMNLLEPTDVDGVNGEGYGNLDEPAIGDAEAVREPQDHEVEKPSMNEDANPNTIDDKLEEESATSVLSSPVKASTGSIVTPLRGHSEAAASSTNPEDENEEMIADNASADPSAHEEEAAKEADDMKKDLEKKVANDSINGAETCTNDSNAGVEPILDPVSDPVKSKEPTSPPKQVSELKKSNKPKNSAWQAMLQKEKEVLAKQKKLHKKGGALVDGEAEEEEDEDGIVGLEDFGFAIQPKKGDDDADADLDVDQDDLDHVVDDVSDGEGDEEAGDSARKRLEHAEEKARHKEMVRRMKEGYDGRRGGITGGGAGGARGTIRFDQLVAAEGREDAKRLGLLNNDELDSDDEKEEEGGLKHVKKGDDEEEDEAALLDKWMKERVLSRGQEDNIEENFTDDEDVEDEADEKTNGDVEEEDEDREQDRLAKHFAKRARRNRILEEFEGDSQFSRSRLIDEDVSTQQDLKTMKTSFFRKRSSNSLLGSNLDAKENNCSSKKLKDLSSQGSESAPSESTSSFLSREGSLSVALMASRRTTAGRKRKTTFLSGGRQQSSSSFSRSHSTSSSSKTVSLNHVVFMAGDSQCATSQLPDSSSNSVSMGAPKLRRGIFNTAASKKSSRGGSSLWSKVCSKNFKAD